jgi:type IV pilus secretin PilQ/predicted competence protein
MRWRRRLVAAALALGYLVIGAGVALGAAKATSPNTAKTATPNSPASPAPPVEVKVPAEPAPPAAPAAEEGGLAPPVPGAAVQATVAADGRIDLHAKNEDLANILELLSRTFQVNIVASKSAKGKVTADLYRVSLDQILDAICRSNSLLWTREGNSIYVFTPEEGKATRMDESRLATEVFALNYLAGEDAVKMVAPALSPKATTAINTPSEKGIGGGGGGSGVSSGGSSAGGGGGGNTGGNSFGLQDFIIVRDFPENLEAVRGILKKMDHRPRQVLVEATILKVVLDDKTSLGVNFNALAGIDFRDLSAAAYSVANPTTVANAATTTVPKALDDWGQARTFGFTGPDSSKGLNIGIISNSVAVFINALESISDTTIVSNPKVLALNKQRAEVIVGDRIPYILTSATETTSVTSTAFLETGRQLTFRPFISDDGYIRMEIHPKVSTPVAYGALWGETTSEVTCNVMVRDGHTIVIGGLFEENTSTKRDQVPGLGNIPGLGWLFRSNNDSSLRTEVIILLTPHIIDNDEAANEIGVASKDDAKRRCLGMRENFAFYTRERITACHMQDADRAWQEYGKTGSRERLKRALWHVQCVLYASPNNLKAMRLRDEILSEKKGEPFSPPNWTIWDSVQERLQEMEEAKQSSPASPAKDEPPPPSQTSSAPAPKAEEAKHVN